MRCTTKEIKARLNEGEIVTLECTDSDGFIKKGYYSFCSEVAKEILRTRLTVKAVDEKWVGLNETEYSIKSEDLCYFRIKGREELLDELLKISIRALKYGAVSEISRSNVAIKISSRDGKKLYITKDVDLSFYKKEVESFYNSRFKVENESDVRKIERGNTVLFPNGKCYIVDETAYGGNKITLVGIHKWLGFKELMGVMVTQ